MSTNLQICTYLNYSTIPPFVHSSIILILCNPVIFKLFIYLFMHLFFYLVCMVWCECERVWALWEIRMLFLLIVYLNKCSRINICIIIKKLVRQLSPKLLDRFQWNFAYSLLDRSGCFLMILSISVNRCALWWLFLVSGLSFVVHRLSSEPFNGFQWNFAYSLLASRGGFLSIFVDFRQQMRPLVAIFSVGHCQACWQVTTTSQRSTASWAHIVSVALV